MTKLHDAYLSLLQITGIKDWLDKVYQKVAPHRKKAPELHKLEENMATLKEARHMIMDDSVLIEFDTSAETPRASRWAPRRWRCR